MKLQVISLLLACFICLEGCSPAPDTNPNDFPSELSARIEERLNRLDAVTSLYAKHVPSGREIAVRADEPMNTLSVIKIPIMIQAFRDAAAGRLNLDERVHLEPEDMRNGSGLIQSFSSGLNPTFRDLITQMIITSDNTATDIMIETVGMRRVNALLEEEGYKQTRLRQTTGELFREVWVRIDPANASLTDREIFERGFPSDDGAWQRDLELNGDSTKWLGRTTAHEMARMLEQILNAELADEASSNAMIGILKNQFSSSRLPHRVWSKGVSVAHKTGDWWTIAGNDVGIMYYEGGPTIISVFTNQNKGDFFELEETLGIIAEEIIQVWQ